MDLHGELLQLVAAAARWRGVEIGPERVAAVAADLHRIVAHARAAAAANAFSDEPARFPVVLAGLAERGGEAQ